MPLHHVKTHIELLFENAVNLNISKQLTSGSTTTYGHYLVYLHASVEHPCDCLMTEVVESEVGYSRSFPRPVLSLTEGHVSCEEGAFLVLRCRTQI